MSWFQALTAFVSAHQELAYLLVLIVAFWESIPVFGLFVPGSTLIVAASILVPSGALELTPVLAAAIVGSIAGDSAAFWMGRRYGRDLLRWGPLARRPELVARSERFFQDHGGKGILLGRFTPPVRGILPAIGGMAGVTWSRFLVAAAIASLGWAPAHVLPGALIGASLELAGAVTARLGGLLLLLLVAAYLLIVLVRACLRWGIPAGTRAARSLIVWARAHNTFVGREILALLDPEHREARALAVLAGLLIIGGVGFAVVLEDLTSGAPLVRADAAIFNALQSLRSPWADSLMVAITELGDAKVAVPVAIAGFLWLAWRRAWPDAVYWVCAIAFAQLFATVLKVALHTPRPMPDLYHGWSAFSFPSGHAAVNGVLYGFLAVMVTRQAGLAIRSAIVGGILLLVGLIALSRLYLGAHWFSDVAGGLGIGAAWVGLLGIAYIRHRPAEGQTRGLLAVTALVLVVAGTINIWLSHAADLARYRPQAERTVIAASQWAEGGWRRLPAYRIDLAGEIEEPFVLQWSGGLDPFAAELAGTGWKRAAEWRAAGLVAWLLPGADPAALPVLPKLHDGRRPLAMFVRPDPGRESRIVLRVWDSHVRLLDDGRELPLWLVTATREIIRRPLNLMALAMTEDDVNGPRDALETALGVRPRRRDGATVGDSEWDGALLLGGEALPAGVR